MTKDALPFEYHTYFNKQDVAGRIACLIDQLPEACVHYCNTMLETKINSKPFY